ncbi:unnamed protein product [Amoebophrya sp. A25]|nr:unnamed protein product [Amoebophrya sp. A25]|eukprot:GSA25T00011578001.1
MPSPENDPDRYSMKWIVAPNPPRQSSLADIEKGEKLTLHNAPIWSIATKLEKAKPPARSPGPKYYVETSTYKKKAPEFAQYLGERTWFNKPKKGVGEKSMGLGPNQIGIVDQKHPLIHREPTATLNNYNPRIQDKRVKNMPPGLDPGRYPPDAKDCVLIANPKWSVVSRTEYVVGAPPLDRTGKVPQRDLRKMHEKGGELMVPAFTIGPRIEGEHGQKERIKWPSAVTYDPTKSAPVDGARRVAPKFSFGTARRFPKPRFPEPRGEKR